MVPEVPAESEKSGDFPQNHGMKTGRHGLKAFTLWEMTIIMKDSFEKGRMFL
ncbi:hypothetical protein [uncultured Faecalibaculum sp.]|uniref:hypothetical protein n=1 Tax=uncultured Faecalibaculum sp. TaxID=1729681 RepID=UPI0025F18C5F|nr:hypothetical protein [uncultured Faecalibaculum sp.]